MLTDRLAQNSVSSHSATACHHCGEPCPDEKHRLGALSFCCSGCQTVYEILHHNGLEKFYEIDAEAGQSLQQRTDARYAYLDDAEVRERLLDFSSPAMAKVSFYLPQVHCASCIWLLEHLYRLDPGVQESRVNFTKKEVYITYSPEQTSLRKLAEMLYRIGYAPEINLNDLEGKKKPAVDRKLIYQLGVAGFAFGNIMLLSFPEYLNLSRESYDEFFQVFAYLNLFLSLPVVFYSARDYLKSAWLGIRQKHLNIDVPVSLGILALFGRSAYEILSQTGMGYMDSLAGLVFFLLIGKWFQQRTYYQLSFERDYKSYFPIAVQRKEGDQWRSVSLDKLQAGDILQIRHGEIIPADSVLLRGEGRIDYSFVTGESEVVGQQTGDKLYAGGRQMGGPLEISLTRTVSQSYLTQLWNNEVFTKRKEGRAIRLADQIGTGFTFTILTIAAITFLWWVQTDIRTAFNAATAVLIIACPCAVALAIPFIFGNAVRLLSRRGFFLKNTAVLEQLTRFRSAVLDKTGTLTRRKDGSVSFEGIPLSAQEKAATMALTRASTHPLSRQLFEYLKNGASVQALPTVVDWEEKTGAGVQGVVEGKLIRLGSARFIGGETGEQGNLQLEIDGQYRGQFFLRSEFREGLREIMDYFSKNGIESSLLTGDNNRQKQELVEVLGENTRLLFRQQPQDKLDFVKQLQEKGREVLMLGDGLNDAGALSQSDCGIVLTEESGSFTPASDAVLQAHSFTDLPTFFRFAKRSVRLVYIAYGLALMYNVVGLSYAVQGLLSPVIAAILMPLSSVTIVVFGLVSSSLLAWRMGLTAGGRR